MTDQDPTPGQGEAWDEEWDEECDVLVVGSGGGGLTGAYGAASRGLDTLLVEKTEYFGGTTAYAGACLWLPGNPAQTRAGLEDSADLAREYFRAVVGDSVPHRLQDAYLDNAGPMVADLEASGEVLFEHRPFPDYYPAPGRFDVGRGVFPVDLAAGDKPDELLDAVRPPCWEERLELPRGDGPFSDGRALIARLLNAFRSTGKGRAVRGTALVELVAGEGGRIIGAVVEHGGVRERIRARRGVLLAAGGFEASAELRAAWQAEQRPDAQWTMGAPGGNTGQAILAGIEAGADTGLLDQAWWCPSLRFPQGFAAFALGFRGGIFVDGDGKRFANENLSYDRMGRELLAHDVGTSPDNPVWWVMDDRWDGELPGIVMVPADRESFTEAGLWHTADSIAELAESIGVDESGLTDTVRAFNGYAADGVDRDFHRGEDPYDTFFADGEGPNRNLVPIERGPFHAVQLVLGDLGTKGGLRTDTDARVLRPDGSVIPGLYAAGNTMASVTGAFYPGPGAPIGSAMTFGWLAAKGLAEREG